MRALTCLVFIAVAHAIRGNPDLYEGPMGSKNAPIGKFPYQVILRYENISDPGLIECGGSILNNRNILTSASCIEYLDERDKLKAHVGTNFFTVPGDVYDVDDVIIHKDYNDTKNDNDIALIHLKTPIEYNKLVQPINLMTTDEDLFGTPCTLTGWGYKGAFEVIVDSLQELELIVWDNQEDLATTQFCALTGEKGHALQYHGGSPLVANGNQIGILRSNIKPELSAPTYDSYKSRLKIFTRVSDFVDWISEEELKDII
ncbi:chymotrypsin-1-like [Temnothorax americanus]|uniref:chymotrypsin-1-like n=1 Tax=Temnothorax americanus TaxID=1964332 RepID=UPI0040678D85